MKNLIHAELEKLRTTRMIYGLTVATLVFTMINVISSLSNAGKSSGSPSLTSGAGIRDVMSASSAGSVLVLVIGILMMAGEFRHSTATSTFLISPHRGRVVGAKVVAGGVVGAALAVLSSALTLALALPWFAVKHVHVDVLSHNVGVILLGCIAATTIYAMVGVGVGSLIRNQMAAVLIALGWVLVVDNLLVSFVHEVGRWTPGGAAAALANRAAGDSLLPMWGGALLFISYGVAFAVAGSRFTIRRDIG